jgi:hypothetical protein
MSGCLEKRRRMFRKPRVKNSSALKDVIVTSDSVKPKRQLKLPALPAQLSKLGSISKTKLISIGVILFIIFVPLLFFLFLKLGDLNNDNGTITVCKNDLVRDAAKAINSNNITDTTAAADKVTKLKNHQKDANCQYILVRQAIMVGDYSEAQKQLTQLNKVYNFQYNPGFGDSPLSPDELQQVITDSASNKKDTEAQHEQNQEDQGELDSGADKLVGGQR